MNASGSGRRVLVTGGTSMLGRPLVERLIARGDRVIVPTRHIPAKRQDGAEYREGDVADPVFAAELVDACDEVFHLASHRRNVAYHLSHRDEMVRENVALADALIEAISGRGPVPVTVYGTALAGTVAGDAETGSIADGYLAAKIVCERLWSTASLELGFPLLIVRPVSAYGPWDTFSESANVIPALLVRCKAATDELVVWGSGRQRRSFVFAPDTADAALQLRNAGMTGAHYLCPQESVTIEELATMIRNLLRPGLQIRFDDTKPEGPDLPPFPVPDVLDSFPWTPLQDGLKATVDWWQANL